MFVSLFSIALVVEGPIEVVRGLSLLANEKGLFQGILLLLFPGILAFCMTSSEFALLQRTNVVTLSICGIFKEVVTIAASGIVFHDVLTPINVSGLVVTIGSIAAYNYLKITKMRKEARKVVVAAEGIRHDAIAEEETDTLFDTQGQGGSAGRNTSNSPNSPHGLD